MAPSRLYLLLSPSLLSMNALASLRISNTTSFFNRPISVRHICCWKTSSIFSVISSMSQYRVVIGVVLELMMGGDWFCSRKPKVVTIPVQDGNTICPYSGNLQERKSTLPEDIPCRLPGYAEGSSNRRDVFKSSGKLKTMISLQNLGVDNDVSQATMSENSAAIIIQSHFRGYMVRRTDPLNGLRVISSVRSQLRKFKSQISSDEYMHKLRADPKERKKLSETIMSLLLRLDGLQNVHPTVREIRRSAVRELIALQDRVDLQLQHGCAGIPEDSKALPPVEYNCSVDGSDFLFFQMIKIRISTRNLHL